MTLIKILEKHSIDFKETPDGEALRICCPFCGNQKYKTYIYLKSRLTVCFRCGERGGIWKFLKAHGVHEKADIRERIRTPQKPPTPVAPSLPAEYKIINPESGSMLAQKAKAFLYKRGLTDADIAEYQIGYCLDGQYAGNIIIPILDEEGKLTGWQGRRFWLPGPKSINPTNANTSGQLFCMNKAKPGDSLILVEGPFDAIVLNKKLEGTGIVAVAMLGHYLSRQQAALIGYVLKPETVWVMLDPDALDDQTTIGKSLRKYSVTDVSLCRLTHQDPDELSEDELGDQLVNAKKYI